MVPGVAMIDLVEMAGKLACPVCAGPLTVAPTALTCSACATSYAVEGGIPTLLAPGQDAFRDSEAEAHGALAPHYDQTHQLETARNRAAHADFLAPLLALGRGARVLEVACGTGHDGAQLVAAGLEFVGSDITRAMLEKAQARLPADSRCFLAVADGEHLPFQPLSFDGVLIAAALHHFRDPRRVLAELARVARPGAIVVVGMEPNQWMYRSLIPAWRALRALLDRLRPGGPPRSPADEETKGLTGAEILAAMAEAGIAPVRLTPIWYATGFLHALLETGSKVLGLAPPLAVPPSLERVLLDLDLLLAKLPGLRRLNWNWNVVGRKRLPA